MRSNLSRSSSSSVPPSLDTLEAEESEVEIARAAVRKISVSNMCNDRRLSCNNVNLSNHFLCALRIDYIVNSWKKNICWQVYRPKSKRNYPSKLVRT